MKPSRNLFLGSLLLVAAAIGLHTTAHAAVLTWDADTGTTGAQDGGGTWTAGGAGWWNGTTNVNWANGDVATFGSGSGVVGNHAITLGSDVSVSTPGTVAGSVLTFASPGNYTISSASSQTIAIAPTIVSPATTANQTTNIIVAKNVTATIGDNVKVSRTGGSGQRGQISIYGGAAESATDGGILIIGTGTDGGNSLLENLSANHLIEVRQGATLETKQGGTFTSTSSMVLGSTAGTEANRTNTLKISGGTVNVGVTAGGNLVIGNNVNASGISTSIVTISDGMLNVNSTASSTGIRFGTNTTSGNTNATYVANGTFNLDGGVATVGRVFEGTVNSGAVINSTFNFNGGELKVLTGTNNAAVFMNGLDTAQVRNGGAKIHTNGVDTTIGQAIVHSTITTPTPDNAIDGGLEKRGAGKLTLTNTNTYTGNTTVNEGILALSGSGSINNSAVIDVQTGTTLSIAGVTTSTTIGSATAQTLKGLGSVDLGSKTLTVGNSGTLAPGNSPGTLGFTASTGGKLDFSTGSTITFELGTISDLISFSSVGDWLTGSGNAALSLSLLAGFNYANTYTIFQNVSTADFTLASITGYNTGSYTANFQQSGNNYHISFTPIPEPRAALLGGLATLMLLRRRRVGQ